MTDESIEGEEKFQWTALKILWAIAIFITAGFSEIFGGWFVWKAIRDKKPAYYALIGSVILIGYGFIPCLQPTNSFGRIYAIYGGFFIVLSFLLGWLLDGDRPDVGDIVGGSISYNAGLASINADFGAIPQVETLYITNMKDIIVKKELSERRPGLGIVRFEK